LSELNFVYSHQEVKKNMVGNEIAKRLDNIEDECRECRYLLDEKYKELRKPRGE
jgi:hypothetical protein